MTIINRSYQHLNFSNYKYPIGGLEGSRLIFLKKISYREFSGGLVVRSQCFHCCGPGLIPGLH